MSVSVEAAPMSLLRRYWRDRALWTTIADVYAILTALTLPWSTSLVAIFMVHFKNGLFMNWAANQKGEGFEYHLLALALLFLIMVRGAGAWSVDYALSPSAPPQFQRTRATA